MGFYYSSKEPSSGNAPGAPQSSWHNSAGATQLGGLWVGWVVGAWLVGWLCLVGLGMAGGLVGWVGLVAWLICLGGLWLSWLVGFGLSWLGLLGKLCE